MEKHAEIALKDISIGYGRGAKQKIILKTIRLNAKQGEIIALVGKNGTGKSTLLKTIAGLIPLISGEIFIQNHNICKTKSAERSQLISYVGTAGDINKMLKVKELVALGRYPYTNVFGTLNGQDLEIISQSMTYTMIHHLAEARLCEISDGELQRTQIARSLAQNTPVILMDEPTAYLDIGNKFEMVGLMRRLSSERNKTILFSSHDFASVLGLADTMWLIEKESIISAIPEDLVLAGALDIFFENTQVKFNIEKNDFKLNFKPRLCVNLAGDPIAWHWTEKALNRIGIDCCKNHTGTTIHITKTNEKLLWQLIRNKETVLFENLNELMTFLRKL